MTYTNLILHLQALRKSCHETCHSSFLRYGASPVKSKTHRDIEELGIFTSRWARRWKMQGSAGKHFCEGQSCLSLSNLELVWEKKKATWPYNPNSAREKQSEENHQPGMIVKEKKQKGSFHMGKIQLTSLLIAMENCIKRQIAIFWEIQLLEFWFYQLSASVQ